MNASREDAGSESLDRRARMLETVLSHIVDFAYTFDLDGRFTYVNKALLDLWGLTLEQAVGKNFFDLNYPDDLAARLQRQIRQVIDTKSRLSDETRYTSPTGVSGYYEYIFSPVLAADGSVEMVAGSTRDITRRKRVEGELAGVRRRHDSALIAGEVGTFEWDIVNDRLWGDQNFDRIFDVADAPGGAAPMSAFVEAIHPDDRARVAALVATSVETGEDYRAEYRIVRGRRERWVLARGKVECDATGRAVRFPGVVLDITAQKRAMRARRAVSVEFERQSRVYNTILSTTDDFAYIFDRSGRFLFANRRLLEVWGKTLDEVIGRTCYDLGYPTWHADMHMREIKQVLETKRPIRGEVPFTGGSGISGVYDYIFTPVLGADGEVEVVAGTTRDITDRKRAEEDRERLLLELQNQQARLAAVIEQAPAFMCTLRGPDHVFELANGRYYEIVGRRDIIGKPIRAALPEIEGQGFIELLDGVYHTGETFRGDEVPVLLHRKGDGSLERRYMNLVYQATRDPDGSVAGIFVHGIDVTEMVESREALRVSEERLRLAVAIAQMGTFDIDLRTDDVTVNDEGREIYGWPAGEPLTFSKVQGHFHPDDRDEVLRRVGAALLPDGPGEFAVEQRIVRTDGVTRWIRVRGRAAFGEEGGGRRAVRCAGTYIDITEQREAEQQREQLLLAERAARAEAERASEAKSEFLATLSHELRTPLTPVLLTVSLMESHPGLPDDLREDVATIRRNVELESRLISDLLDLTRIARGKMLLDDQEVDLHLVVRSAVDICQREASAKLTVELNATRHTVRGDGTRLQQVFWNLINNAIKFTGPDGRITVRSSDAAGDRVCVEVTDTGTGIDPAILPKLFNAFEQGEVRAARQQAGLGLGLAISKRLAEAHGGTITASSPGRGQGATFAVELPAVRPLVSAAPARRPAVLGTTARPLNVLLVEDHESTLDAMSKLLRRLGHRVTGVTTAASATSAAAQHGFDLIISDLGLPDGSGLDVMRQLRHRYAGRAIALTGYGMESDVSASREAGFAEHVTKPVDPQKLQEIIERVTGGASAAGR